MGTNFTHKFFFAYFKFIFLFASFWLILLFFYFLFACFFLISHPHPFFCFWGNHYGRFFFSTLPSLIVSAALFL
ncbi:hypothetical protein TCDM_12458 [Trypanosoma cruzi Dm28c]|uniref:Uncharacterized protein n=1 Tax=Trypanosoma cruzi Dm28c TaxID=1416333 RepID=V5ANU7_TRYCR|nr:hypothetical protein TCDM_12458 [Trypanosoma cruzi Dm28c]